MADLAVVPIWNAALGQQQLDITLLKHDTWPANTKVPQLKADNLVVGISREFRKEPSQTRLCSATLPFYGVKESDQRAHNFPALLTIRPLDRSVFRCYGLRHPPLTSNSPSSFLEWGFPLLSGSWASPKNHCVGLQPALVEPARSREAERRRVVSKIGSESETVEF